MSSRKGRGSKMQGEQQPTNFPNERGDSDMEPLGKSVKKTKIKVLER